MLSFLSNHFPCLCYIWSSWLRCGNQWKGTTKKVTNYQQINFECAVFYIRISLPYKEFLLLSLYLEDYLSACYKALSQVLYWYSIFVSNTSILKSKTQYQHYFGPSRTRLGFLKQGLGSSLADGKNVVGRGNPLKVAQLGSSVKPVNISHQ